MPNAEELLLGVCAKGVVVYEVKNNTHTMRCRFHWRETINIFAAVSPLQQNPGHVYNADHTIIKTSLQLTPVRVSVIAKSPYFLSV